MPNIGDVVPVTVGDIRDFGFFADGVSVRVLVELPDIASGRTRHPNERVQIGQKVWVRLVYYNRERDIFRASMRMVEQPPVDPKHTDSQGS